MGFEPDTTKATVGIASSVVGVITSFQKLIEWNLRTTWLLVGQAFYVLALVALVREMRWR